MEGHYSAYHKRTIKIKIKERPQTIGMEEDKYKRNLGKKLTADKHTYLRELVAVKG